MVRYRPYNHYMYITYKSIYNVLLVNPCSQEKEYTGTLALKELITGGVVYIKVIGEGSADELHLR